MKSNFIYYYVENLIHYRDLKIELPSDVRLQIKESWEAYISQNKTTNGELFTLEAMQLKEDILHFYVNKTTYDHYIYSRKHNFDGKYICRSLAANILPLTSDHYYVLGVMADWTSLANKIKFIGGALSKEDLCEDILDPFKCVIRETKEELGIDASDEKLVLNLEPTYFVTRNKLSFINTLFFADLSISSQDVLALFRRFKSQLQNENKAVELKSIIFLENQPDKIKSFIEKNKDRMIDYMEELLLVLLGVLEAKNIKKEVTNQRFFEIRQR